MWFGQIRLGASGGVGMCVSLLSLDLKGHAPGSQLSQGRPLRCQLFLHLLWPHPHPSLQHGWCHDDVARGKTHCTVTETSGNIHAIRDPEGHTAPHWRGLEGNPLILLMGKLSSRKCQPDTYDPKRMIEFWR